MTKLQVIEIRKIVDLGGWDAVRVHPVYGPLWESSKNESKKYSELIDS